MVDGSTGPVDVRVQELLDGFTAGPAMICNARFDCVAFNRLADYIYRWDSYKGPFARNFFWHSFMDPVRRRLYADWETGIRNGVGFLRANYASHIGDPEFESLIKALLENNKDFVHLWNEHQTASLAPLIAPLNLPRFGEIGACAFVAGEEVFRRRRDKCVHTDLGH